MSSSSFLFDEHEASTLKPYSPVRIERASRVKLKNEKETSHYDFENVEI